MMHLNQGKVVVVAATLMRHGCPGGWRWNGEENIEGNWNQKLWYQTDI